MVPTDARESLAGRLEAAYHKSWLEKGTTRDSWLACEAEALAWFRERMPTREEIGYQIACICYGQPLMGIDWTKPHNKKWLEAADAILALLSRAVTP